MEEAHKFDCTKHQKKAHMHRHNSNSIRLDTLIHGFLTRLTVPLKIS